MKIKWPDVSKVLIVDDSFLSRRVMERMIRTNFRCGLEQAEDGSQALQMMLKEIPDLLILDMYMPFMTGIEVLRTMRKNSKLSKVPVIACTSVDNDDMVKEIIKLGIRDYLIKPIDQVSLIDKVGRFLN